jgi:hypothetical protein
LPYHESLSSAKRLRFLIFRGFPPGELLGICLSRSGGDRSVSIKFAPSARNGLLFLLIILVFGASTGCCPSNVRAVGNVSQGEAVGQQDHDDYADLDSGDGWFDASMRHKLIATMAVLASGSAEDTAIVFHDHLPLPGPLATTTTHQEFLAWYPLVFTPMALAAINQDYQMIASDPSKIKIYKECQVRFGRGYLRFSGKTTSEDSRYLEPNIEGFDQFTDRMKLEDRRVEAQRKTDNEDVEDDALKRKKLISTMEVLASGSAERTAKVFGNKLPLPYPFVATATLKEFEEWYPLVFSPGVIAAIRDDYKKIVRDQAEIDDKGWKGVMFGQGYLWLGPDTSENPEYLKPSIGLFDQFFDRQALKKKTI